MSDCIEWVGKLSKDGYGMRQYKGKKWRVHRLEWTLENGPIPDGLFILHKCDNRACYNIEHLFIGTQADNMKDMVEKGRQGKRGDNYGKRSKCKHGHPYTPENTYMKNGRRICRECARKHVRDWRARQRS